ncbi:MAG: MFS transporter [Phycisphaerales bacterium]
MTESAQPSDATPSDLTPAESGPAFLLTRLSVMLFLQFFIWGSWYLSVSLYMYDHQMGAVRFYAYTAGPIAAIIAPFFTGLVADRFFNTERVLGVLFALAGVFMLALIWVGQMQGTPVEGMLESVTSIESINGDDTEVTSQIVTAATVEIFGQSLSKGWLFNALILAHMLCFMPTLGLTASLSFAHLRKGPEQFPLVRLWGTLGWIAAGFLLAFAFTAGEKSAVQFCLGGTAAVLLGVYCFSLPRTPAPSRGKPFNARDLFFVDAWSEMRRLPFAVFIIGSFLVCIPLAAYYASLQQQMEAMGMENITAVKNYGTFLEAGMMFMMPFFFRTLGIRWMVLIGIAAWVLRYVMFALGATPEGYWLVVGGILLHGICYDFFFVTGQVYVDKATPPAIRGQAQGMLIFFTQGLGLWIGAMAVATLSGRAFGDVASTSPSSLPLWPKVWWPLAIMAAVILVIFAATFRDRKIEATAGTTGR